jgi:hypothetical protein
MALFSECSLECASKLLDTADIVREAVYRQLTGHLSFRIADNSGVDDEKPVSQD